VISSEEDQVPRRRAFETAHPGITISPPRSRNGRWTARQDNQVIARERELKDLLDELEGLLGGQ